ncbi:MAG TPA: SEL1-like repeat protein [Candidatus Acidoferrales bacterium]|jgi:TPR repeat protein|nr:SEL1-like repeat protein [Candidatus Acidoferrales bacterium]
MKTALLFILISATYALGQNTQSIAPQAAAARVNGANAANQQRMGVVAAQEAAAEQAFNEKARRQAAQDANLRNTLESHPWRIIDGATQKVNVAWCVFSGTISHARAGTSFVFVNGEFHPIYPGQGVPFGGVFMVRNYPYEAADGDMVPRFMTAMPVGVINFRQRSMHCLDFGLICAAPGSSPEEIAAARKAANDKAVAANEAAAASGDAYGLLRMGERYRDGDGVETNLDLARSYLSRAAAAGDTTASKELAALPAASDASAKP